MMSRSVRLVWLMCGDAQCADGAERETKAKWWLADGRWQKRRRVRTNGERQLCARYVSRDLDVPHVNV